MPRCHVVFFKDEDGSVPALLGLEGLLATGRRRESSKCYVRIARLQELGWELTRPEADLLRDDIRELRIRFGRMNYRVLYFFHGKDVAVLSRLIAKEGEVPTAEIERAIRNKQSFGEDPERHTWHEL